jgi:hypothetical protein
MWRHIERRRAQSGWTALIWAAEKGHADCARLLLDAGADKNAKTNVRACVGFRRVGRIALGSLR